MADTPTGETVAAPSNGQATPVTPPVDTGATDVERYKAELQQAMRANQVTNDELKKLQDEKEARDKADAESKAKQLEEQNQFKELYEQEKTKREAIETEKEEAERLANLTSAREELLADYSDEVKALAKDVGVDLSADDEASKLVFKEKLDKINQSVVSTGKVTANNPRQPSGDPELSGDDLRIALSDDKTFEDIVAKKYPGIASMLNPRK